MANNLKPEEAEAIAMLEAGNPKAFKILIDYFNRQYNFERTKCVDEKVERVEIHQGRARAFRDSMNVHNDAVRKLNS
jgi:hypothetical protein